MVRPHLTRFTETPCNGTQRGPQMFSLSEAAKLTGQSKSTIWRAIKSGRLSASRTDTGDYQIDPAELHRVFPLGTASERPAPVSLKHNATGLERPDTDTETALRA